MNKHKLALASMLRKKFSNNSLLKEN